METLENYFAPFREQVIGKDVAIPTPFGPTRLVYADWTASGRAYRPIENYLQAHILPFMANTHTRSNYTGTFISQAYADAKQTIKRHVNANEDDVLLFCGSGMTAAVNKLQRILGLRLPENLDIPITEADRPVVFVTHMEHHSNHISWLETIATVDIVRPDPNGNVDLTHLQELLCQYRHRKCKIAAVMACSNVTGIETPYQAIAQLMHQADGVCFVDFACSAPYVEMDMHPKDLAGADLDAIYFSPHKFLGGPGTPGVLVFNRKLYRNRVPDQPGGGTVLYSDPWGGRDYVADIEEREDGGTPPIIQAVKAGRCILLKEEMGIANMREREEELMAIVFERFAQMPTARVLEPKAKERLAVVSFLIENAPYDLIVRLLNDRFGIQVRGGCSCAGTYGHYLLEVDELRSAAIRLELQNGHWQSKPGWVRLSLHPVMTDHEVHFIMDALQETAGHWQEWSSQEIVQFSPYNADQAPATYKQR